MGALEAAGTEQNRTVYPRHGVRPPMFGVSYAELSKLQKRIGVDHELARELWETGNHDARILATKIADPGAVTVRLADAWIRDCDNYVLMEAVGALVARSPVAGSRAAAWRDRSGEWAASAGWVVTARLALEPGAMTDAEAVRLVGRIQREIHAAPNRVRHEMNGALIAFGLRGGRVRDRAMAAAERIGTVRVDHGQTSCVTPDAVAYIRKTEARARAKQTAAR
jgi:3-methyladenine DNA glycosylase AlkD